MTKDRYIDLYSPTELQTTIMRYVDDWVHTQKTPIPQKEIIREMAEGGHKSFTVVNALRSLLKMGYIRRGVVSSNKTVYVMLRKVS